MYHRAKTFFLANALVGAVSLLALPLGGATCDSLNALKIRATTITSANVVAPGAFLPAGVTEGTPDAQPYRNLPEFCRVQGVVAPSPDSHIEFEVWLPTHGWNRKYEGIGNGGFAGAISYAFMAGALANGYATSSTDTGHQASGTDASWALDHPEKRIDFGYRAIHETALASKTVIRAFHGEAPQHSYFTSCSNGGRQALMEAQRYPEDYDGIIAGAPANYWTHLMAEAIGLIQATAAEGYIPAAKIPAIEAAVLAACDATDGIRDGIVGDPRKCRFDPALLLCRGEDSSNCLTRAQVAALKRIYTGVPSMFPGRVPGAEGGLGGWSTWITGTKPESGLMYQFSTQFFKNMVYQNAAWNYGTFRDSEIASVDQTASSVYNARNPDLGKFKSQGGKLILYHGWNDPAISALSTIDYYDSVVTRMGRGAVNEFARLFLIPGMQHCGGGPGWSQFDAMKAIEDWVEHKQPPNQLTGAHATNGQIDRTRPICAYPMEAKYKGTGSTDDAANFTCALP
jgi:hypothetical protein